MLLFIRNSIVVFFGVRAVPGFSTALLDIDRPEKFRM